MIGNIWNVGGSVFDVIYGNLDITPGIGFDLAEKGFEGRRQLIPQRPRVRDPGHVVLLANLPFLQLGENA